MPRVAGQCQGGHWSLEVVSLSAASGARFWESRQDVTAGVAIVVSGVLTQISRYRPYPPSPVSTGPPSDGRVGTKHWQSATTSPIWDLQVAGEQHSINGVWGGRPLTRLVLMLLGICDPFYLLVNFFVHFPPIFYLTYLFSQGFV